jgi:hypothetical protein
MSLTILSLKDVENINEKKHLLTDEEVQKMYSEVFISNKCLFTNYGDWNNTHTLLFDSYRGDKLSFHRDDVGFIPSTTLKEIINSNSFQKKYKEMKREFYDELDLYYEWEFDENEDLDKPDIKLLENHSKDLKIIEFIIKLSDEGISYS